MTSLRRNSPGLVIAALAMCWTLVLASLLALNVQTKRHDTRETMVREARGYVRQLVVTRVWNAFHGPIYAPISKDTQPNPYIQDPQRDVVTTNGVRLTMVNPAYMTRQLSELSEKTEGIRFHLTSRRPIRPANSPDPWEDAALRILESGLSERYSLETNAGSPVFRYMGPLRVEASCLQCHGFQGYREGELRGGLSVTMKAEEYLQAEAGTIRTITLTYSFIWGIGLLGTCLLTREVLRKRALAEMAETAKTEFLASMSHEIRTPLNGVIGMTELILDTELTPEQRSFADAIRTSGEGLLTIVNDILNYSKLEAGKLQIEAIPFDLETCLEEAVELLAPAAHGKRLELAILYPKDAPRRLVGDPGRIRQIILNLAGNAIKFTEAGCVWIEVTCTNVKSDIASMGIAVHDTGIGIPPEKLSRLFLRFSQADSSTTRKYGGTGLGLAISKTLVEIMDGHIEVISHHGEGSTFSISLPMPLDTTPAPPVAAGIDLHGLRVLIVDDVRVNRMLCRELCLRWGMRPDEAAAGEPGLALLAQARQEGDPYRILLLDYNMPQLNGNVVAQRAKEIDPDLPIILLTSTTSRGAAARSQSAGCRAFLVKPVKSQVLLETIQGVLTTPSGPLVTTHFLAERRAAQDRHTHEGCRVLLADDNVVNRRLATRILERFGCTVDTASNGSEAVEMAAKGQYSVIFMDCLMPGMDGLEATAIIRKREPAGQRVPVIALTALAMVGDRERCLEAGMDDYVTKPIDSASVEEALRRWSHPPSQQPAPPPGA